MSTPLYKATPRPVFNNIRDSSRLPTPSVPEQLPTHLPHMFGFAAKGSLGAKLGGGSELKDIFGSATFDPATKFANHQTALAADLMGRQQLFFERLPAPGMATAMLRLAIEIVCDEIPDYTRDPDTGYYTYDTDGDPVSAGVVNGQRIRWVLNPAEYAADGFGAVTGLSDGTMTSTLADQDSKIYPIMDILVSYPGGSGNDLGIRFGSPVTTGANPADSSLMEAIKAYLHTIQVVEQSSTSTPSVIATLGGALSVTGVLKPGVLHPRLNTNLSVQDTLIPSYRLVDQPGYTDKEGPFEDLYVYDANFEAVLDRLINGTGVDTPPADFVVESEFDAGNVGGMNWSRTGANAMADAENAYMLNPFTGKDLDSVPYFSFVMATGAEAGVVVSGMSSLYAAGGADGDTSARAFDEAVRQRMGDYDSFASVSNAMNMGKYPWSDYYDTGFSLDTKKAMVDIIAKRPDINMHISTQEVMAPAADDTDDVQPFVVVPQNDLVTDNQNAQLLSSYIRAIPESVVYGTDQCRIRLVQQAGWILGSPYKGMVTLVHEIAQWRSTYMGAGNGVWARGQSPQRNPNNIIRSLYKLNHTFRTEAAYDAAWDAGCMWAQTYDMSSDFIPAQRTIYRYPDSVLLSTGFVDVCVEATKVHFRVWRDLVGRDDLSDLEFQELSDEMLNSRMQRSRFDDRFEIRSRTVISADDSARGWSWQAVVEVYGNKMKLVGSFTVDGRNMADLEV